MKQLMLGNEAIARGAYEAGVRVSSAYPGTPSTEIFEQLPQYKDSLYCEWAPNEKVATEVAYGASIAGSRSFCTMKMVGLNVAADPLFTAGYMVTEQSNCKHYFLSFPAAFIFSISSIVNSTTCRIDSDEL